MPAKAQAPVPQSRPARTTHRGIARGEQILTIATTMFLVHGYAGVSVDEIVKTVGGSKTNVYRQFGGKEGLFVAVVEALCAHFLRDFNKVSLANMSTMQALKVLAKTLTKTLLQERHIAFQRLIIAESGRFPALGRIWFESGPTQSRAAIAGLIKAKQLTGDLREFDATAAATLFHDMVVTNPLYLALIGTPISEKKLDRHIKGAVDLFLRGLES
jgi:TetR/AcrR family transcriptional repressor of mexJK operon